ncbi:MAG: sulfatase-like hydrolase/transferase [Chloroflexi bacterium]|nr:sulfatase-like hydrolase/transferase [Chloroflexota bacterium]OJW04106.1 MAG: hypothetical protein BGO39_06340 [Chloroflexi bacterium 54-19]
MTPNILFIIADQHRYDCLGAYGNTEIKTPHLDALAAQATVYENAFCTSPICTPARYSLVTGLYPHQHLGWTNRCTIPPGLPTFPQLLKQAGYKTTAVGKFHQTPTYLDVGFERMELAEQDGAGRYDDDYHRYLKEVGLDDWIDRQDQLQAERARAGAEYWVNFGAVETNLPEDQFSTNWIGDRGLAALQEWKTGQTNLLMVSFIKPHHPFDVPAPWSEMYNPADLTPLPGWLEKNLPGDLEMHPGYFPHEKLTLEKLKRVMARYYGSISQIDDYVGKMVEVLKAKGLFEDTLIIYTSDHGEYLGFHHLLLKQNYVYDPLARIPLIIKYPESSLAERDGRLVSQVDLTRTLLGQGGVEAPNFFPGIDLKDVGINPSFVFCEEQRGRQYMVRSHTRKLILGQDASKSQFFDLENDVFEQTNLFADARYQPEINLYREKLAHWILFDTPAPTYLDPRAPQLL